MKKYLFPAVIFLTACYFGLRLVYPFPCPDDFNTGIIQRLEAEELPLHVASDLVTEKILDVVAEQLIVKDAIKLIDSLSNGKRHISLIPFLQDTLNNIYLVKVAEDNGVNFVSYYNFLINANTMVILNPDGKLEN